MTDVSKAFLLIFGVLATLFCKGLSAEQSDFPLALARAAAEYDRAQCAADRETLQWSLADDYIPVNGAAETENKEQLIADFTAKDFRLDPFTVEKARHIVWDDGAVLSGEVHLTGSSEGHAFQAHTRYVDVWRLRNGHWQVVFTQVTRFPTKP